MSNDHNSEAVPDFQKIDPFPDIPPALLNSADIHRYIKATGMISPYCENKRKSASYTVGIAGKCIYWDENGIKQTTDLDSNNKKFALPPNSIAFVELEPEFKLPDYIAVRFNLKITNIYRGLLMGTGPLIDPGFEGKIFVPLHNLTDNTYEFKHRESIVWLEFTKTSPIHGRDKSTEPTTVEDAGYVSFPEDKKNIALDKYIDKASSGRPIISSIPGSLGTAARYLEKVDLKMKPWKSIRFTASLLVFISVVSLVLPTWKTLFTYLEKVQSMEIRLENVDLMRISENTQSLSELEEENETLRERVRELLAIVAELSDREVTDGGAADAN